MNQELKDKIAKIMELINRGATDGEKAAAKKALERIIKAHNIDESQLSSVMYKEYEFRFSSLIELELLASIIRIFIDLKSPGSRTHHKRVRFSLLYEQWVTVECSYEYFRRHMRKQYYLVVTPQLKKTRKAKTRRELKAILDDIFISDYKIASRLYKEGELKQLSIDDMSVEEMKKRASLNGIEGGSYNKQVMTNLLLEY